MASILMLLLLGIFSLETINISFTNGSSLNIVGCIESEKQALLMFKQHLVDPANRLASWVHDEDCCRWEGIVCDNVTGHVLQLQLRHPPTDDEATYLEYNANERLKIGGKINNSLLNLKHLSYLDLSNNEFEGIQIPTFLGSIGSLRYLNLSNSEFGGSVPSQLGNLSNLQYLNLNSHGEKLFVENLQWLSGLSQLKHLELTGVNLNKASEWLHMVTTLHSLEELHLSFCQLPLVRPIINHSLPSLAILDLSGNFGLYSSILDWVYSLKTLVSLDLGSTGLKGPIPDGLSNLTSLKYLDLSGNSFNSPIPDWLYNFSPLEFLSLSDASLHGKISSAIGNMTSVTNLDLSNNRLSENLPKSFGQLKNLEILDISYNLLEGDVDEILFTNLTNLRQFHGNGNPLNLKVGPNWIPPLQLETIRLRNWNLGPKFPPWLHSKTKLKVLDISESRISDTMPSWFWQMCSQFYYLNISHNQIHGQIPDLPVTYPRAIFDLNSNSFSGPLPRISSNLSVLGLSSNNLSDNLSNFLCSRMNETMFMESFTLGQNRLFGHIPNCWMKWQNLSLIVLSKNYFTGFLPPSLGTLRYLHSLHLSNNRLSGELPPQLKNCRQLTTLDLNGNEFKGLIPAWLGLSLQNLIILSVSSNQFHGSIPNELCALGSLQVLDLSHNNLSGNIPKCIGNFSAMSKRDDSILEGLSSSYYLVNFFEYVFLVMKGRKAEYNRILSFVKYIDLSENNLQGWIPDEITMLQDLLSLNLSHNHLIGSIPRSVGAMTSLESIDFSMNRLFGSIPESISNLTFLSYLNLSNNNLIGKIPSGTQLQGFDPSSFAGNQLCGPPLSEKCSVDNEVPNTKNEGKEDDGDGIHVDWFYVMMAIGFATGLGAFLVPLTLSVWWRSHYFQFLDEMWTRLLDCNQKLRDFIHFS